MEAPRGELAYGHTAVPGGATRSSPLLVLCCFWTCLLSGTYISSSFLGCSCHLLLTSQLLQELLLLGQMVPPSALPQAIS